MTAQSAHLASITPYLLETLLLLQPVCLSFFMLDDLSVKKESTAVYRAYYIRYHSCT